MKPSKSILECEYLVFFSLKAICVHIYLVIFFLKPKMATIFSFDSYKNTIAGLGLYDKEVLPRKNIN